MEQQGITLSEILRDVLLKKQHCSLENLGSFFVMKKPARLDKEHHFLYPPCHELRFNPGIRHSDPLLVSFIQQKTGWNEEYCRQWLREQLQNLIQWIQWKKYAELPGMGIFRADEKNNLFFECRDFFHPGDWGFELLVLKPVPDSLSLFSEKSKATLDADSPVPSSASFRRKTFSYPMLRAAAFLGGVVFLSLLILWTRRDYLRNQQVYLASVLNYPEGTSSYVFNGTGRWEEEIAFFRHTSPVYAFNEKGIAIADLQGVPLWVHRAQKEVNSSVTSGSSEVAKSAGVWESNETPPASGLYRIIAGAFSQPGNAEKFVTQLRKKGFPARLAGISPRGLRMVSVFESSDPEQTRKKLEEIRSQFSSAWICKPGY